MTPVTVSAYDAGEHNSILAMEFARGAMCLKPPVG